MKLLYVLLICTFLYFVYPSKPILAQVTDVNIASQTNAVTINFDEATNTAIGDVVRVFYIVGGIIVLYVGFQIGLSLYRR